MKDICKVEKVREYGDDSDIVIGLHENGRFTMNTHLDCIYYGDIQIDLLDIISWINEHQQYLHDLGIYNEKEI